MHPLVNSRSIYYYVINFSSCPQNYIGFCMAGTEGDSIDSSSGTEEQKEKIVLSVS
jgi:hypothetical protein|uniref:Uncharacterized protein n=1 Tax=Zea mays TaxID=4577 RepID=C0P3A5_MAIZE|nr:unknown [Zea mays]